MKRVSLLTMVLMLTTTMVYANDGFDWLAKGKKGEGWGQQKFEKMTKDLNLTEEQAKQIKVIQAEKMEKKKAVREEMKTKMDVIRGEYRAKVDALLNEEQKAKHNEMIQKREEKIKDKKGKGEGYGPGHMHKKGPMMDDAEDDDTSDDES